MGTPGYQGAPLPCGPWSLLNGATGGTPSTPQGSGSLPAVDPKKLNDANGCSVFRKG